MHSDAVGTMCYMVRSALRGCVCVQILLNTSDEAQLMAVTSIACNLLLEFSPSKEVGGCFVVRVHTCY